MPGLAAGVTVDSPPVRGRNLPYSPEDGRADYIVLPVASGSDRLLVWSGDPVPSGDASMDLQSGKHRHTLTGMRYGRGEAFVSGSWPFAAGAYRPELPDGLRWEGGHCASNGTVWLRRDEAVSVQGHHLPETLSVTPVATAIDLSGLSQKALPSGLSFEAEQDWSESGGRIKVSEGGHAGVSGGGNLWAWNTVGHKLFWDLDVPQEAQYELWFVGATETGMLAELRVNEGPPRALWVEPTGGWGRQQGSEWQAFRVMASQRVAAVFALRAGKNRIALTNWLGVGLNLDRIVLVRSWHTQTLLPAEVEQLNGLLTIDRAAFLANLKLDKPELAEVKTALEKGDVDSAARAYVAHFRRKPTRRQALRDWSGVERDPAHRTARADAYLAGDFSDGYSVYKVPESGIDWVNAPLTCLTRFPCFGPLHAAFYHTGEPKYLRFVVDHIHEYMAAYPITEFVGKSSYGWVDDDHVAKPWHWSIHAHRLRRLGETLDLFREHAAISDEEMLTILQRIYQEAAFTRLHIKHWVDRRHNGGLAMIGDMTGGCEILDDFRIADTWADCAAQLLAQYIHESFYPDGACLELTMAYSGSITSQLQRLAYHLREREGILAARDKLAAMVDWAIGLGKPTGRLPSFGDLYAFHTRRAIYTPILEWLGLSSVEAMLAGTEHAALPYTVWPPPGRDAWCGYYSMRSNWTAQALYLCIDCGPWGTSHQHGDRLSFVVSAYGADFIIDPSSTKYRNNEPDAFISTQKPGFLHNTITIDGVDQFINSPLETLEPLDNRWEHGTNYSLFAGEYSLQPVKPARWQRRILFVDKSYWIVQDVIDGQQDSGWLEQNFQFEKDTEIEFDGRRTIATAPNGARLLILPLDTPLTPELSIGDTTPGTTYWYGRKARTETWSDRGQERSHGRGWTGRNGNKLLPAPAVTYTGTASFPAVLTVGLVPLPQDTDVESIPQISSEPSADGTVWVLPTTGGALRLVSTAERCEVQ